MKDLADFQRFQELDIRVGRIIKVEDAATRKPTYRMTIDFGEETGTKISCGAYTNYAKDELIGRQVVAIINFGAKKMGPEVSEVLVLGVSNEKGETVYLKPQTDVRLGAEVF